MKYSVEKVCVFDPSVVVFSTPSRLLRNPASKIARGGVLSYHPSVIVSYGTVCIIRQVVRVRNENTRSA